MMGGSVLVGAIALSLFYNLVAHGAIQKVESEIDESSCICGLNKDILDKLESLLKLADVSTTSCQLNNELNKRPEELGNTTEEHQLDDDLVVGNHSRPELENQESVNQEVKPIETNELSEMNKPVQGMTSNMVLINYIIELTKDLHELEHQVKDLQGEIGKHEVSAYNVIPSNTVVPSNIEIPSNNGISTNNEVSTNNDIPTKNEEQIHTEEDKSSQGKPVEHNQGDSQEIKNAVDENHGDHEDAAHGQEEAGQSDDELKKVQGHMVIVNSGFLTGVHVQGTKNTSSEQTVQKAVQSTVPNVVSNIFTNIQNLTEAAATDSQIQGSGGNSEDLVSIDGSKVSTVGQSNDFILAEGERLFLVWIERQIEVLHLSASMANYIRKSSMDLFRRIMKQYVNQVSKLSGGLQSNVRRATQLALNNTQNLVSFMLKNYVNFAGGMMQIIGEQVSRVGKHLDSTGETIAHTSLNPFDIVSNVMDSLPNPSDYSKYFRAFGKQLMGNISSALNGTHETAATESTGQQEAGNHGLIRRTMGALGKTLGSWMG